MHLRAACCKCKCRIKCRAHATKCRSHQRLPVRAHPLTSCGHISRWLGRLRRRAIGDRAGIVRTFVAALQQISELGRPPSTAWAPRRSEASICNTPIIDVPFPGLPPADWNLAWRRRVVPRSLVTMNGAPGLRRGPLRRSENNSKCPKSQQSRIDRKWR